MGDKWCITKYKLVTYNGVVQQKRKREGHVSVINMISYMNV